MAHIDSLATGPRDTDEIEVTEAMIAAGRPILDSYDPNGRSALFLLPELFRAMELAR